MNASLLIVIGIIMTITGFAAVISRSTYVLPPTEPPIMRSLEGIDYIIVVYSQMFLFTGIVGTIITVIGIILWRKRK